MKKVQEKDLGNYTCNATNIVTSVVALLTLKGISFIIRKNSFIRFKRVMHALP